MTSHELARKLLEGADLPVQLQVNTNEDGFWGSVVSVQPDDGHVTLFTYADEEEEQDEEG